MPWTLNQQIVTKKLKYQQKNQTKKDQEKWLNLGNYNIVEM
jgi:hypothetical protein